MKIKLRHFTHPIESGKKIIRKAEHILNKKSVERELEAIRRGKRTQCWCGGALEEFAWHKRYGVCSVCGSYVNIEPPLPEEMSKIYSFDFYWHFVQKGHGYPTIEARLKNDREDGRIDFWKNLVKKYKSAPAKVVEVGCSYGGLLKDLKEDGYDVVGLEPDEKTAEWTCNNMGIDVRAGFFPDVNLPKSDVFLAFDVIEHSADPEKFMHGISDLLNVDGVAIIQTPIDRYNFVPPFGERFNDAFSDMEHLFIFTDKAMEMIAQKAGLQVIDKTRIWLEGEIVVLQKKS